MIPAFQVLKMARGGYVRDVEGNFTEVAEQELLVRILAWKHLVLHAKYFWPAR